MPEVKNTKLCVDDLRHNEYYEMLEVFDELYARAQNGEVFTDLMSIIPKRENILLAYRSIKANTGSNTAGTDNLTIKDIGKLSPENVVDKVRYILTGSKHGYRPRAVRRVEIPKSNGDIEAFGYSVYMGQIYTAMYKASHRAYMRGKIERAQLWFQA